jgi:hypothetical protein
LRIKCGLQLVIVPMQALCITFGLVFHIGIPFAADIDPVPMAVILLKFPLIISLVCPVVKLVLFSLPVHILLIKGILHGPLFKNSQTGFGGAALLGSADQWAKTAAG